ncbi:MAG: hypothetical protein LBK75_10930, partial [Oscillospiraceae bacterium]|nr:hypothetical protein [Oscillospiraceae bacterium]
MKKVQFSGRFLSMALVAAIIVSLFAGLTPAVATPDIAPLSVTVKPFIPAYTFQDGAEDTGDRLNSLINELTLEEKIAGAGTINRLGVNGGRTGGGEGLHGVAGSQATVFPSSLGLSQTWDDALLEKIGDIIAKESEAGIVGGLSRLTPVLDLLRDPRYGRAYETYGEDAFLTGSLGTAIGKGMTSRTAGTNEQEYLQFLPNVKHPLAYNNEINRLWTNSSFTPRNTYEYYI